MIYVFSKCKQRPRRASCVSDVSLFSLGSHPGLRHCLPAVWYLVSVLNKLLLCVLAQTFCPVPNSELCICFYRVCLFEIFLLSSRGKTQGHFASGLWPLLVWQRGLLVLIQAPHIQCKTAHCCLRDHLVLKPEIQEFKVCIKATLGWT